MKKTVPFTVYSASAGSGKTFTLVKEYLKIILLHDDVFHFQNILAITFTNKAAMEMKQRVLESLQDFARNTSVDMLEAVQAETAMSADQIQHKSKRIIAAMLRNYAALNITTIDSFTHRIIRSFAYDFGLSMDFDIEMDVKILLEEAVNAVVDQIGIDDELTKVLIAFALQKSDDDKTWDISQTLQNFAFVLLNESDKTAFKSIAHKQFGDYQHLIKRLKDKRSSLEARLELLGKTGVQMLRENGIEDSAFNYTMLPNFLKKLATRNDVGRTFEEGKLWMRFEQGTLLKKKAPAIMVETFDALLPQFWDIYHEAEQLYFKLNLWGLFRESIVPLSTLSYIFKALERLKEEKNIKLIAEFNELIFAKIQDQPTPFIYERLGEKFQHYFIDEMQDTSLLQWQNLAKLIDNAISQEGGSLLLVGDAKQAIYRWRGGESEQFINLANPNNTVPFNSTKQVENLETNYRSYSEVISFNNSFFQHIASLLHNEAYTKLYKEGNQQKINTKVGGFVQLDFLEKETDTEDKKLLFPEKVLETITNLDQEFDWKDICVLVRKNKDGVAVASYLTENGIAVISSDSLLLASDVKVRFIVDVLQSLQRPQDKETRLSALYFLHTHLGVKQDMHLFFSELVEMQEADYYKALEPYDVCFSSEIFHQKTLYDAVEYLIRSFELAKQANAYLQYFLDEILNFQMQKGSTLLDFLLYWEQKKTSLSISMPEGQNAVQVMSIHKAKGLQFPVVIFPYDLDIYKQIDPKVWYPISEKEEFEGFEKLLIPYRSSLQFTDEVGAALYQNRRELLELDNYNLLYVALTRAVEQLYIISEYRIHAKTRKENTKFYSGLFIHYLKEQKLWDDERYSYTFGSKKRISQPKETTNSMVTRTPSTFISVAIDDHKVSTYQKDALLWGTEQGEAIEFGNLVHEVLAQIITAQDVETTLIEFINRGSIKSEEVASIRDKLYSVIQYEELKAYFQPNLKVFNERKIVTESKDIIIPDRLVFLPNNRVVVIDYKTGLEESKHIVQIQKYAHALGEMGYEVTRKLLVYMGEEIRVVG